MIGSMTDDAFALVVVLYLGGLYLAAWLRGGDSRTFANVSVVLCLVLAIVALCSQ